jgi:ribosomal protein L11 methyltransferase
MSFGTGEHATTKLVIQLIDKYVKSGEKVLDVGSGTGVLAISTVLLGAQKAIGIDNDEWCLLNGSENVKANNLENKVEIRLGELKDLPETGFDLIVANINKHILVDIAKEIKVKIKKTGKIILSGLLNTDENDILKIYSDLNLELIDKAAMDEWIALVFKPN